MHYQSKFLIWRWGSISLRQDKWFVPGDACQPIITPVRKPLMLCKGSIKKAFFRDSTTRREECRYSLHPFRWCSTEWLFSPSAAHRADPIHRAHSPLWILWATPCFPTWKELYSWFLFSGGRDVGVGLAAA